MFDTQKNAGERVRVTEKEKRFCLAFPWKFKWDKEHTLLCLRVFPADLYIQLNLEHQLISF
jgi:hypothetical protein